MLTFNYAAALAVNRGTGEKCEIQAKHGSAILETVLTGATSGWQPSEATFTPILADQVLLFTFFNCGSLDLLIDQVKICDATGG